jgi:drug/metabolite transporter (DMT)-like permease
MWQSVLIMFIAMSLIPAGDIAGKFLTGSIGASPIYVAWSRFTIGAILVIPFLPRGTLALFRDWRIWFRGAILAAGITSIQFALKTEPIADVFAAFFIAPIISYILSILFLGERVTPLRTVLICLGFAGVLLVVRPGFGGSVYLLYAVMAGSFYGVFLTSSRWLGNVAHPLSLAFSQMVIAGLLLAPFGVTRVPDLTLEIGQLTVASALFSMLGNLLLIYAYRRTEATLLAPLVYFQLLAATILGYIFMGDLPDALTWAGLALVIGSGIASAVVSRERSAQHASPD